MKTSDEPVVVRQTFNTTAEVVWDAITRPDQMRQWFFENIPAFEPKVGFETQFNVRSGDRNFRHMWKVTEVVPRKRITYDWKYEEYPGDSFVVFELSGQKDTVTLTLTCHVREDFPDDIPEFRRESCLEGWKYFIGLQLKEYLDTPR